MDRGKVGWLAMLGLCLAACGCGSSTGTTSRTPAVTHSAAPGSPSGSAGGAGPGLATVHTCLARAGFGVTAVPADLLKPDAEENRGPGQAGELLVGPGSKPPQIDSSTPALVVVASWMDAAAARRQVRTVISDKQFAEAFGTLTLQPDAATPAQFKRIEACLR